MEGPDPFTNMKGSGPFERVESRAAQGPREPDEWEADQGRGVARLYRLEQDSSQAFAAKSAGAVEWAVALDIARDLFRRQVAKPHDGAVQVLVGARRPCAHQDHRSVEFHRATTLGSELRAATHRVARLVENFAREIRDLV